MTDNSHNSAFSNKYLNIDYKNEINKDFENNNLKFINKIQSPT